MKDARAQLPWLANDFEQKSECVLFIDAKTGHSLTYGEVMEQSRRLAGYLEESGVRPGDAVVVSLENCLELALLYLACMHAGARVVPINPSYHPRDYAVILGRVRARHAFASPAVRGRIEESIQGDVRIHCFLAAGERVKDAHRGLITMDVAAVRAGHAPSRRTWTEGRDEDVFLTMFTSGSTGVPKGINITYGGLLGNGRMFARTNGMGPENRFFNILAMTYLGGVYNLMLIPMLAGGSVVLDSVFGPSNIFAFWERVREHGVNTLWFSPTMLSMLLALEEDEDFGWVRRQIRLGLCGMAPLPIDLKKRFEERFGFPLLENYALSETVFLTANRPGVPARPGSVGAPLDGVTLEILGEDGQPLPRDHQGQIAVRTPYLMKGYDQDGTNVLPLQEGRFLTGDIGKIDAEGELFVTGRLKDIIIRGGVNISPKTIEDVVYGLEGVGEAAVVGVPHPVYGEEVALVVTLRDSWRSKIGVDDVRKYCEANIAHFQRPKFVFFIDEIPKGATGKIQKTVLRKLLVEKLDPLHC